MRKHENWQKNRWRSWSLSLLPRTSSPSLQVTTNVDRVFTRVAFVGWNAALTAFSKEASQLTLYRLTLLNDA